MADSQESSQMNNLKAFTPEQRRRWQDFVNALEASQIHLRPDRLEAIELLVKQFQSGGPIFPVALPQPDLSPEEKAAATEELIKLFNPSNSKKSSGEDRKANSSKDRTTSTT